MISIAGAALMDRDFPRAAMKALQWEIAKGHLRSLVAIDGAVSSGQIERPYRFEVVSAAIEKFIREFEDKGLHE